MTNKEISRKFSLTAKLMELHGENKFKARSYSNASFNLSRIDKPIEKMDSNEIASLKGVGDAIAQKIEDLLEKGSFKLLDELTAKTPEGIMELLQIKGLGASKLKVIWKDLGVETPGELLYACKENRLMTMKGFGEKTQKNVQESLEYYLSNRTMYLYARLEPVFDLIQSNLKSLSVAESILPTGDFRRGAVVLERLDFLLIDPRDDLEGILLENGIIQSAEFNDGVISGKSPEGIPLNFHLSPREESGLQWIRTTGSKAYLESLSALPSNGVFEDEYSVYSAMGKELVPPEMREAEVLDRLDNIGNLVTEADIKGVIHNHSNWSDGAASVEEMARACIEKGYEYLVMSDHSRSAFYANGLDETRVLAQQKEIDELNQKLQAEGAKFKVFKSIESDVLADGSLDYSAEVLDSFDLIIASIHSSLRMDEEKAMMRLMKAIENPATKILGHMTGRLLLSRPGYPVNHHKIIDACAENDVVIEINANPMRLDIDWRYIPYAMDKGVMISINPDAHQINGIDDIHYGTIAARKGGLTREMCLNTLDLDGFEQFIAKKG